MQKSNDFIKSWINTKVNEKLINACENGDLSKVKELINTEQEKINQDTMDKAFSSACNYEHLDIVRYLLTAPELVKHSDIKANNYQGFRWCCNNGTLEIVKYLLTSSELTEHADIHADNDRPFNMAALSSHLDIIHFFIFEMNIEKTILIKEYLKEYPSEDIEHMFNIRELNKNLNKELNSVKTNKKKMKV